MGKAKKNGNDIGPSDGVRFRVLLSALFLCVLGGILIGLFGRIGHPDSEVRTTKTGEILVRSENKAPDWRGSTASQLGALLVGSAAVASVWELFVRQKFHDEALLRLTGASTLVAAGARSMHLDFYNDLNWATLIESSSSITVMIQYAEEWRKVAAPALEGLAQRKGTMRVFLPDSTNNELMEEIAGATGSTAAEAVSKINDAASFFLTLGARGASVEIRRLKKLPTYGLYIFDSIAVCSLYTPLSDGSKVPTFVFSRGGTMFNEFFTMSQSLMDDSNTKPWK